MSSPEDWYSKDGIYSQIQTEINIWENNYEERDNETENAPFGLDVCPFSLIYAVFFISITHF